MLAQSVKAKEHLMEQSQSVEQSAGTSINAVAPHLGLISVFLQCQCIRCSIETLTYTFFLATVDY